MANNDMLMDPMEEIRFRKRHVDLLLKLVKSTHFSRDELESLFIIHHKITKEGLIDRKRFREIMHQGFDMPDDTIMDRIFSAFDKSMHQYIDLEGWADMMSIFLRGTLEERIIYAFSVYDLLGDGYILKEGMFQLMRKFLVRQPSDEDLEEGVRDMVDVVLKKMDVDRDGKISFNDFKESVKRFPPLLEALGPCIPSRKAIYTFIATFTPTACRF